MHVTCDLYAYAAKCTKKSMTFKHIETQVQGFSKTNPVFKDRPWI